MKKKLLTILVVVLTAAAALTGCTEEIVNNTEQTEETTASFNTEEVKPTESVSTEPATEQVVASTEAIKPTEAVKEDTFKVEDIEHKTMYAKQTVNVRKGPSTKYERIGGLSTHQAVTVTGVADTGWYRIDLNGTEAYVSNSYLLNEKPVAPQPSAPSSNTGSQKPSVDLTDESLAYLVYSKEEIENAYNSGDMVTYQMMFYANLDAYNKYVGSVPDDFRNDVTIEKTVYADTGFLNYINDQREALGLSRLEWSSSMEATALERAEEITTNFSHDGMRNCDGEICQQNHENSYESWYSSFYNSEMHRNIMLFGYRNAAVGVCKNNGTYNIVVLFE